MQKLRSELPIFDKCGAHFSVGKIIYWVGSGQVELTGWANFWVGIITYYLPPCQCICLVCFASALCEMIQDLGEVTFLLM